MDLFLARNKEGAKREEIASNGNIYMCGKRKVAHEAVFPAREDLLQEKAAVNSA